MRVWIAEKPSAGRDIGKALGKGRAETQDGYVRYGDEVFTWLAGHLLEQCDPQEYNAAWGKWHYSHLPIHPPNDEWKNKPKDARAKAQLSVIGKLVKQANEIVHAGDTDREGQLIVDEVLEHLRVPASKKVSRLLVNNLNAEAIRKEAKNLRDNKEFKNRSLSAKRRSEADWTVGMNLTRAYSAMGGHLYSVGRVQTPVLALIVRRDLEIEQFEPKPFYELSAEMIGAKGRTRATWVPGAAYEDYLDESGRLLNEGVAQSVMPQVDGQPGKVTKAEYKKGKTPPPLGHSQSALQTQVLKMKTVQGRPDDVLAACQNLYEKHKILTYPRTDCQYYPEDQQADAPKVLAALAKMDPTLAEMVKAANPSVKSRAFDDKKISAHHAIAPTGTSANLGALSPLERTVFMTVAKTYIAQFLPPTEHQTVKLEFNVAGERFTASRKVITEPGFGAWFGVQASEGGLPVFSPDEAVKCEAPKIADKQTTPPEHFTASSLIQAMASIAKYVSDPSIKKVLRETDGIGTEATRANIVKTLFDRDYIVEKGKKIISTVRARNFIGALDPRTVDPGETAAWELSLNDIERRGDDGKFMAAIKQYVKEIVEYLPGSDVAAKLSPHGVTCPKCGTTTTFRSFSGNEFFGCMKFPDCKGTVSVDNVDAEALAIAREMEANKGGGQKRRTGKRTSRQAGAKGPSRRAPGPG